MTSNKLRLVVDRRLRRELLKTLRAGLTASEDGFLSGETLKDLYGPGGAMPNQARDVDHLHGLLLDLVGKGMAEMKDGREYRDERHGLGVLLFKIKDLGSRLLNETAPPDADIYDDRRPKA